MFDNTTKNDVWGVPCVGVAPCAHSTDTDFATSALFEKHIGDCTGNMAIRLASAPMAFDRLFFYETNHSSLKT